MEWIAKYIQLIWTKKLKSKIAKTGANLLVIKQKHLGSDKLPSYIDDFTNYLTSKGVEIVEKSDVYDVLSTSEDNHTVLYKKGKTKKEANCKNLIIAPGRTGTKWVQELADKYQIPYISQSIEVGVRVEIRKELMEDICSIIYDPTIFIKTPT